MYLDELANEESVISFVPLAVNVVLQRGCSNGWSVGCLPIHHRSPGIYHGCSRCDGNLPIRKDVPEKLAEVVESKVLESGDGVGCLDRLRQVKHLKPHLSGDWRTQLLQHNPPKKAISSFVVPKSEGLGSVVSKRASRPPGKKSSSSTLGTKSMQPPGKKPSRVASSLITLCQAPHHLDMRLTLGWLPSWQRQWQKRRWPGDRRWPGRGWVRRSPSQPPATDCPRPPVLSPTAPPSPPTCAPSDGRALHLP